MTPPFGAGVAGRAVARVLKKDSGIKTVTADYAGTKRGQGTVVQILEEE